MKTPPDISDEAFLAMANDWLEGRLRAEDREDFRAIIEGDPGRRRLFASLARLEADLRTLAEIRAAQQPVTAPEPIVPFKRPRKPVRLFTIAAAASIVAMVSVAVWKPWGRRAIGPAAVVLDSRWSLQPAAGARYTVLAPDRVRLDRGELRLTSSLPANLVIETPNAKATASGTDFLIGHHADDNNQPNTDMKQESKMKTHPLTRLLILAGTVTLTSAHGEIAGGENEALLAADDRAPEKILVESNTKFAMDCYAKLAGQKPGENVFFSPYSISSALLMVAEGARGETAREMGDVLGFPESLRRTNEDAQLLPWNMGLIRSGYSQVNRLFDKPGPEHAELLRKQAALIARIKELQRMLHQPEPEPGGPPQKDFRGELVDKSRELDEVDQKISGVKLSLANAVWSERKLQIKDPWRTTVEGTYGTGAVQPADFITNPDGERLRINKWVEEQTGGLIKDAMDEGSITSRSRLVLANAIHFKGEWVEPFPKDNTQPGRFLLPGGGSKPATLMQKSDHKGIHYAAFNGDGSYFNTPREIPQDGGPRPPTYPGKDGFSMVEIPYRNSSLAMIVIAPNDPEGLPALEAKLSPGNLTKWLGSMKQRETRIILPKFSADAGYDLNDTLVALGMPSAFDLEQADFTGMVKRSVEKLCIGQVAHRAVIKVDEIGTEAAAFSVAAMPSAAMAVFIPTFRADRPFIHLIRDRKSGTILFLGRIMDPAAE